MENYYKVTIDSAARPGEPFEYTYLFSPNSLGYDGNLFSQGNAYSAARDKFDSLCTEEVAHILNLNSSHNALVVLWDVDNTPIQKFEFKKTIL